MDERLSLHGSEPFAEDFADVRPKVSSQQRSEADAGRTRADDVALAGPAATA